jgi:DNA polymerase III epsilon subunit family exonuclease
MLSPGHDFAVVDVETTGVYSRRDRIVAVAVARVDEAGQIMDTWSTLVNPQRPVTATEIHGLDDEMLETAPRFEVVADEILHRIGGSVVVGHNVTFDWRFLSSEFSRSGFTLPDHDGICTMALASLLKLDVPNRTLASIAAYCNVDLERDGYHNALEDAMAAAGVFGRLYPMARDRNLDPVIHLRQEFPPALHKIEKCAYVNPGPFALGGQLVQGMHVVITGATSVPREEIVAQVIAAGLDPVASVSAKTSLLVTNNPGSGTHKATTAAKLGVPVIDERSFLALLNDVAPGTRREHLVATAHRRRESRSTDRPPRPLQAQKPAGPLAGRRILLLGQFPDADMVEEVVRHNGGVVSHNVSKNVSLVVTGDAPDHHRLDSAAGYGAEVITEGELLRRLHIGDDLAAADQPGMALSDDRIEVPHEGTGESGTIGAADGTSEGSGVAWLRDTVDRSAPILGPPAPLPPPGWYPDPARRFQYRYWDGVGWTAHTSSNGEPYLDPLL